MLPLFCYCQLDNFAWGTRGIDASETTGQDCKDVVEKKPYEVGSEAHSHLHLRKHVNKHLAPLVMVFLHTSGVASLALGVPFDNRNMPDAVQTPQCQASRMLV